MSLHFISYKPDKYEIKKTAIKIYFIMIIIQERYNIFIKLMR